MSREDDVRARVQALLQASSTLTLATVSETGKPLGCNLFFASDEDLSLVFTSGARSRHSLALTHRPQAAVTVYRDTWRWDELYGVQMEGVVAHLAIGAAREQAWWLFQAKFDFASDYADEISRSEFYRFQPQWVRLIDHREQFGYQETLTLQHAT